MTTTTMSFDELIRTVAAYDREDCKSELRNITRPQMDFNDHYLDRLPLEKLRHLTLAAVLHARKIGSLH